MNAIIREMSDIDRFLTEAPAPMRIALNCLRTSEGRNEALKDALDIILKVERETDVEKTNALLIKMAAKVALLRELLEDVEYTKSEAWAVVEEMQRFAESDVGNK